MSEADYERGVRAVWLQLLTEAIANLGYNTPEANKAAWIIERERTIAVLRDVCDHCGDNDWPDNLSLGDVVDKHLYRHLDHAITTLEKLASLYRREAIWKGEQESVIADALEIVAQYNG